VSDVPTRDCPKCHGRHTMNGRPRPHGIRVSHWSCVRCGFRFDAQDAGR